MSELLRYLHRATLWTIPLQLGSNVTPRVVTYIVNEKVSLRVNDTFANDVTLVDFNLTRTSVNAAIPHTRFSLRFDPKEESVVTRAHRWKPYFNVMQLFVGDLPAVTIVDAWLYRDYRGGMHVTGFCEEFTGPEFKKAWTAFSSIFEG